MGSGDSFSCICRDGWEGRTCTHSELGEGASGGGGLWVLLISIQLPVPSYNCLEDLLLHPPTSPTHLPTL